MIPATGFEGRKVAVFGLGRTGLTAAGGQRARPGILDLWHETSLSFGARCPGPTAA
mgnify:CR=1 FL=1